MADPKGSFLVGALEDGTFVAASVSNPIFCFIGDNEDQLIAKAERAVRFFHSDGGDRFAAPVSRSKQVVHFIPQRRIEVELEAA